MMKKFISIFLTIVMLMSSANLPTLVYAENDTVRPFERYVTMLIDDVQSQARIVGEYDDTDHELTENERTIIERDSILLATVEAQLDSSQELVKVYELIGLGDDNTHHITILDKLSTDVETLYTVDGSSLEKLFITTNNDSFAFDSSAIGYVLIVKTTEVEDQVSADATTESSIEENGTDNELSVEETGIDEESTTESTTIDMTTSETDEVDTTAVEDADTKSTDETEDDKSTIEDVDPTELSVEDSDASEQSVPEPPADESSLAEESSGEDSGPDEQEQPEEMSFFGKTDTLTVSVTAPAGAFPEGTVMTVSDPDDASLLLFNDIPLENEYDYVRAVLAADISFTDADGVPVEPDVPVSVVITPVSLDEALAAAAADAVVAHMDKDGEIAIVESFSSGTETPDPQKSGRGIMKVPKKHDISFTFETKSFSPYAVIFVGTYTSGDIQCGETTYHVAVEYDRDAKIPEGAELVVTEITETDERYALYSDTLALSVSDLLAIGQARLFDISIIADGQEIQPSGLVSVTITYSSALSIEKDAESIRIAHFASEDAVQDYIVPSLTYTETEETREVTGMMFDTDGFSVYAPVTVAPAATYQENAQTIADIDGQGFYLSVKRPDSTKRFYFLDTITSNARIAKSKANDKASAKVWYFEKVEGTDDRFYMYTKPDGETKMYCVMKPSDGTVSLSDTNKTEFIISNYMEGVPGTFYIKCGTGNYGFNMRGGDNGNGFNGNTNRYDVGSEITFTTLQEPPDDPYSLNNASYAMMIDPEDGSGIGLGNEAITNNTHLSAKTTLVRPDPTGINYEVHVLNGDEMSFYTFHNIEQSRYYITTMVNGSIRYLRIKNASISLVEEPDEDCELTVKRLDDGKISIRTDNGYWLALQAGDASKGFFATTAQSINSQFRLLTKSNLTDEDFTPYSATKVSVSDLARVHNGQTVVIYTRKWNEAKKKYEFFVVNHNGTLFPAYDTGDSVKWVGSRINTVLWDFTEYYYEGTTDPNYYYELQSTYSDRYAAPQIGDGKQILSDNTIGINLIGRKNGAYFTPILAWDDAHYDYAAWKLGAKSVEAAPMAEADDFYFAILNPTVEEGELTTVETVDNNTYGITMKMIDFNNALNKNRDSVQMGWFGYSPEDRAGLLSIELGEDGYPVGQYANGAGLSLADLYDDMTEVNHLFIKSIYQESGYFEYNSTENFATLLDENGDPTTNFTVYNQLGAITGNGERRATRTHGQFMPYNDIQSGVYAYDKNGVLITNLTDVNATELPETNPRKGESLYRIGSESSVDYFFGMEMEANFMMTESGQDDWNHDLIFEFSGDDDFWLYLDGQLVLDLGGVHSAMTADINFHTGVVHGRDKSATTLRAIFESNYRKLHPQATNAEVAAYLDEIFVRDGNNYIFKDFTSHNIKVYYMERGAGASNLRMRFNLSSVEPGEVTLTKNLTGTDKQDYASMQFPYQIWYRNSSDEEFTLVDGSNVSVTYKGTVNPVDHQADYHGYANVFLLHPGEEASIHFANEDTEYYITECYVNTNIYDDVTANETQLQPQNVSGERADFSVGAVTVQGRKKVIYENHVNPDALRTLTVTKRLYDADGNYLSAEDDPQGFRFRVYLGNGLDYYMFDTYCVRNEAGEYCVFDANEGHFVSTGIAAYDQLSDLQKRTCTFTSSMSGSVDKIPSGYSMEIRNLLPGTSFRIEERERDIPFGYEFDSYVRVDGSYIADPGSETANTGTIRENSSAQIEVHNKRGWGLIAKKEWYDESFMVTHDDIYMGVFVNGVLKPDTLRILHTSAPAKENTLYWYFSNLDPGTTFADYDVREVALTNPVVNADGFVTAYDSMTVIEGSTKLLIGGQLVGEEYKPDSFSYGALYETGTAEGAAQHVRTDTVVNTRDGIRLVKTDWDGNPLSGGKFVVLDPDGDPIGPDYYTADANGQITIAYLRPNLEYTLTEVEAPLGYARLEESLTLSVDGTGIVTVTGANASHYVLTQASSAGMASVTLKNRRIAFNVRKIDSVTEEPLPGVHFAIYRQRYTGTEYIKDYIPLTGYTDLVSGNDGYLSPTLELVKPGTYYLSETVPLEDYMPLGTDIIFRKEESGEIVILSQEHQHLMSVTDESGRLIYDLTIPNENTIDLSVSKTVSGNMGSLDRKFKFSLTECQNRYGGSVTGTFDYYITDADKGGIVVESGTVTITGGESGNASFTKIGMASSTAYFELAHHQTIVIEGVPKGISFTLAELVENNPYETSVTVSNASSGLQYFDGEHTTPAAGVEGVGCSLSGTGRRIIRVTGAASGGIHVAYLNALDMLIPTGEDVWELTPLVFMFLPCILLCLVLVRSRKKRKYNS